MIKEAITGQFTKHGLAVQTDNTDLIVAFLLIIQNNASTTSINDYFGYGRSGHETKGQDDPQPQTHLTYSHSGYLTFFQ